MVGNLAGVKAAPPSMLITPLLLHVRAIVTVTGKAIMSAKTRPRKHSAFFYFYFLVPRRKFTRLVILKLCVKIVFFFSVDKFTKSLFLL